MNPFYLTEIVAVTISLLVGAFLIINHPLPHSNSGESSFFAIGILFIIIGIVTQYISVNRNQNEIKSIKDRLDRLEGKNLS